jgi:hypothetical protein
MRNRTIIACIAAALAALPALAADDRFYRRQGDAQVYRLSGAELCAVVGQGQLAALGGAGRVEPAPPRLNALLARRRPAACPWPDGFYRYPEGRQVYLVRGDRMCEIVGEGQLEELGGAGRVRVVGRAADLSAGKRDIGPCPWPEGFYRYPGRGQVYYIEARTICSVVGEGQLMALGGPAPERVRTVGARAGLERGRRDIGPCPWPDGFYRYARQDQVYWISGRTICAIRGPGQLAALGGTGRVQTVGPQARLEAGMRDLGVCR